MAAVSWTGVVVSGGGDVVRRTTPGLRVVVVAVIDAWAGVVTVRDGEVKCAGG